MARVYRMAFGARRAAQPESGGTPLRRGDLQGIWVPLVTPFDAGGRLIPSGIAPLVDWLVPHGIRGLLALGTTGEGAHLSEDEAEAVVDAAVRAADGRVPVLAGAGRPSTRHTIGAARRLAAAGAQGVLVMTPAVYRARMDRDTLRRHYDAVAADSPVPVFVYHIPEVTGLDLDPETLADILQHDNVWGFKDSSTAGGPLAATLGRFAPDAARPAAWVGAASRVVAGIEAGAAGALLAAAHAAPAACVALEAALRRGARAEAEAWQARIAAVAAAWSWGWAVSGLKQALRARGLPAGHPRAPLAEPPAEVARALAAALAACDAPV